MLSLEDRLTPAISITALNTPLPTETFDTLAISGATNDVSTLPAGWTFTETGTNKNATYAADDGTGTGGNTYSYGSTGSTDRALGTLLSGSLVSTIGASYTNNTGGVITGLDIAYTGEEWRLGAAGRADKLDFKYSLNATSLTTGTWIDVDALDFSTPTTTGTVGKKDGTASGFNTKLSTTISSLSIPDGATFWIRWVDLDVSGSDDGLAVDDFSLKATGTPPSAPGVTSIVRVGSDVTTATSVDFTVTFSESVNGVNASDFTLTTTGLTGASITNVTPAGPASVYTVTVGSYTSGGTVRLDLTDDDSITNLSSVPLGGAGAGNGSFATGDKITVGVTVTLATTAVNPVTTSPIPVTVTFSDTVTGFDASDLTLTNGTAANFAGTGANYTFDLVPSGAGIVSASIAADAATGPGGFNNIASNTLSLTYDAPISISTLGTALTENFDSLASAGTSTTVPGGWHFSETLLNADGKYTAGTGSGTAGDTYSYGDTVTVTDRAFGQLRSNGLASTLGATYINNSGQTITGLEIAYFGEQWRSGATTGGADQMDFQYSLDATSLTTGNWVDVDPLDFKSPNNAAVAALNGNDPLNRTSLTSTISSLSIPNGATFWIRWTDADRTGADDGLAIDDFSLKALGAVVGVPSVSSIVRVGPAVTTATSVDFTVTFSEAVNGVDASDFALTKTGLTGATITNVTPAGPASVYTVTVSTYTTDGTVRLDLTDNDSIVSLTAVPLGGTGTGNGNFATGDVITVDTTTPTVSVTTTASDPTGASPIPVTVTFSEPVTGFDVADLTLTNGTATNFAGSGATYTFDFVPSAAGVVSASVAAGVGSDAAGNLSTASNTLSLTFNPAGSAISITALNTALTENFDTLASTGTSAVVPLGWFFSESLANANTTYAADDGAATAGNTYSYGSTSSTDRAFGQLRSGNLASILGASYVNNSGSTITDLDIAYIGEQWRGGSDTVLFDQMDFQYSLDATSLTTGAWVDFNALDFKAPNGTAVGKLDGNDPLNRTSLSATISSLSIPAGTTFWIRWNDADIAGSDDGLAIEDFSLTAMSVSVTPTLSATIVGNDLVITDADGSKNNALTVSFNGTSFIVTDANEKFNSAPANGVLSNGDKTLTIPATDFTGQIKVNGSGGSDVLTVDFATGNIARVIAYDGGTGADTLVITGGTFATITSDYTNSSSGTIKAGSNTVTYTNLAPVDIRSAATDLVFNLPTTASDAFLEDDGTASNNISQLRSANGTFELTSFVNPSNSVTIARGNASDSMTVSAMPDFDRSLTIGSGSNRFATVKLAGAVTLSGTFDFEVHAASSISLTGSVVVGGDVTLNASGPITQTAGVLQTASGILTIDAVGQTATFGSAGNKASQLVVPANVTVLVNGSFDSVGFVQVNGKLGGSGSVGVVTVAGGGTIAPGTSPGQLTTKNIVFNPTSTFNIELNGVSPGVGYDQLIVGGTVNLGSATLSGTVGFTPTTGQVFKIIDNDGTLDAVTSTFNGFAEGAKVTLSGLDFTISYKGGDGNDVTLTRNASVAPPTVTGVTFGDGSNQRSMVKQMVVTFSEAVSFSGGIAAAFTLARNGTNSTQPGGSGNVTLTANPASGSASSVTITFSGGFTTNGSLNDGFYDLTIDASQITGAGGKLDGNGDTIAGGNFTETGSTGGHKMFRLFGDGDGNGITNLSDFASFRAIFNLGASSSFDYGEGDNNVGLFDFAQFRGRFNLTP